MPLAVSPAPLNTKPLDEKGAFISGWAQMFVNWWTTLKFPANANPPPASSIVTIASGGAFAFDQNYLYVSTGKNQWKRITLQAF
jgi:hypothetical protein